MNTETVSTATTTAPTYYLERMLDDAVSAQLAFDRADEAYDAHYATKRPETKHSYNTLQHFEQDQLAQVAWDCKRFGLSGQLDEAAKLKDEAIGKLAEHVPARVWFRYGNLAVAYVGYENDDALGGISYMVHIEHWSDDLPDIRYKSGYETYLRDKAQKQEA